MKDSSQVWTPDFGDKLGDLATLATKYGISKVLESSRYLYWERRYAMNVLDHSMRRHDLPGKLYKESAWTTGSVFFDWDRLGARTSLEFYPLCELVSC
ncbi:hypothetical protein AVEN_130705-1 [Araneus ventricosus]|uniref:Uncharacterized protein n=1 Tax=Araneus ventricosus TaxID=182803 RepID=A0A4Y2F7Y3_ARAVE|nr:hypothetical protein AVEN_130705-1 [Araneus ventricosus]